MAAGDGVAPGGYANHQFMTSDGSDDPVLAEALGEIQRLQGLIRSIADNNSPHDGQTSAEREVESWLT